MSEDYLAAIKPQDIWIFPNISPKVQRRYYDKESLIHPAKMPVFFVQKIITSYTKPGDIVLDLFGGSGSTLIAAEQTGRVCYIMELDSRFCSAIIERFEAATGKKAQKLNP